MADRVTDIWGPRTPYAGCERWPTPVDQVLTDGLAESDVDRWVQSACVLCSNGCGSRLGTPHMDGNTRLCTTTAAASLKETLGADGQSGGVSHLSAAAEGLTPRHVAAGALSVALTTPVLLVGWGANRLRGVRPAAGGPG
jgi:hypothetical protein